MKSLMALSLILLILLCAYTHRATEVTLLDFQISGSRLAGAAPSLIHLFLELKKFASENNLYLHMNALTRALLSWETSASFPTGRRGHHEHQACFHFSCIVRVYILKKKKLHWGIAQELVQRSGYSGGPQIFVVEVRANFGVEHCIGGGAPISAGHLEVSPAQQ